MSEGFRAESFRALSTDFYVNLKLGVKMDLPQTREPVLELFERVRRRFPSMDQFRKYKDELALESAQTDSPHRWLAVRSSSVRAGVVNPDRFEHAYDLHRHVLEVSPYFLTISPLDVDFVELLFGFDLECGGNHDAVIYDALMRHSPIAGVMDLPGATPIDCQPILSVAFGNSREFEAHFEVKSRTPMGGRGEDNPAEPISVYVTVRRTGAANDLKDLPARLDEVARWGEELVETRVVPSLLVPLRDAIAFGSS